MICGAQERPVNKDPSNQLLSALGHAQWTVRRDAVTTLLSAPANSQIQELLNVLRDQHRDFSRVNAALQVLARTAFDVVPELLPLLAHPDHEVRAYTALLLGERGDPRAISGLLDVIKDADANVRMNSVEALGKLRAGAAVESLIALVEALDFELAFPAIDALIAIGDQRMASRLLPLLQNSLFKVVAVEALGRLGNEEHIPALLALLSDADVPPAEVAVSLSRIHDRYADSYGDLVTVPAAVRSLASSPNMQTLLAAASSAAVAGKHGVITVLSWLPGAQADDALVELLLRPPISPEVVLGISRRGPSMVPLLIERLPTTNSDSRKAILECLTRIGDGSAASTVLNLLDSQDDEELLLASIEALMRLGDKTVCRSIHTLFGHPSARIRQAAVSAMNSLGQPGHEAELLADLRCPSPLVRESALRAAASLGLPSTLEAVLKCCGDVDERVRRAAIDSLPTFEDRRVYERLSHGLRTDTAPVRAAAANALSRVDDIRAAAPLLAGALEDGDVWVRYFSLRSLMQLSATANVTAKLAQLATADPAMQVRLAATEALGACGPAVVSVLKTLAGSENSDIAQAALHACAHIRQLDAQQIILDALNSGDAERQVQAIRALKGCQTADAADALRPFALGHDERLAGESIEALSQLQVDRSADILIEAAAWPSRREICIRALSALSETALPALKRSLTQAGLDTRRAVVEALSRIRSASAIDVLEIALEDDEPAVRHAAITALAHLRPGNRAGRTA